MFSRDWQHADFKCGVQGSVRHRPSVTLKRCKSSSASFGCFFPRGVSQIVTAEQRGQSPWGEPKYPGNQASFSLQEPFSIPDTPRCLLFPPFLISSHALCFWALQTFCLITLISPKVVSFILSPTSSPHRASYWSVFNLFLCLIWQWCIAEYNAAARNWFLQLIKMSRTDILLRLIPGRHHGLIRLIIGLFSGFAPMVQKHDH